MGVAKRGFLSWACRTRKLSTYPSLWYARANDGSASKAFSASVIADEWSPLLECAAARFEKYTAFVESSSMALVYDSIAASYCFADICELPVALCFSAAALSAADGSFGVEELAAGVLVDAADALGALIFSRVFRYTSKMDWSVAGLTDRRSCCAESDGSTSKASPMHWTTGSL